MSQHEKILDKIDTRIRRAVKRYGDFASSHEAIGVALEEWDELKVSVHSNDLIGIREECIDLAAVLIRLADQIQWDEKMKNRSVK